MKSHMQYLIWSSIVAQLVKSGDTSSSYYNMAFAKMKQNEPQQNHA
jgi:hypothetical protein